MFSPANDIMIIHRGKKGIRGSVQASSVTRKREMSLLVSNSLSFFLSFEEDILDLENLRSVVPWPILGGKGGTIIREEIGRNLIRESTGGYVNLNVEEN